MARSRTSEPLRGAFIAIIAAAIGAGGSLAANAMANANAQRTLDRQIANEDRIRRDDLRRDAYQGFVSEATTFVIDLQAEPAVPKSKSIFTADLNELIASESAVRLVGSPDAAQEATAIREDLNMLMNNAPSMAREDVGEQAEQTFSSVQEFVDLGSKELHEE
jgi:hypothetical protein